MNKDNPNKDKKESPPTIKEIKEKILSQSEEIIKFCTEEREGENFFSFEKALTKQISQLACLFIHLFLIASEQRQDYSKWIKCGLYYFKSTPVARTIKTAFGPVRYWRPYLAKKDGKGGFYLVDAALGLTIDGFTPFVMSLITRLATRVSFQSAVLFFKCFYGWSPSTESTELLVLGIGRKASAYMEIAMPVREEGEVLVIECDGKATPTATKQELLKRRGKRKKIHGCSCNCQRHRGKTKRQKCKHKRRKKGDKSKNGRSTTIAVMYTLKKGEDGQLHGPINKTVWASYAPRKVMIAWIRRQATKRGFPPDTDKRIHIVVDGEKCLRNGLLKQFPNASFALDIRHVEEKLWKVGRLFYPQDKEMQDLEKWIEEKRELLYQGRVSELIFLLKTIKNNLSSRAKRDQNKRKDLTEFIRYIQSRIGMMVYKKFINEDLPIASGIVEGAARYVVGERMDCSGMRWIPERAEALLQLRCIELNGDWDQFFQWCYNDWWQELQKGEKVIVRTNQTIDLSSYDKGPEEGKSSCNRRKVRKLRNAA